MLPLLRLFLISLTLFLAACSTTSSDKPANSPPPTPSPVETPKPDPRPKIVAFGDSLSAGYGVEAGLSYPDFLQKILDEQGYSYHVVNQGLSGDTTSGGVSRMQQAIDLKPAIIILELGGNDGLRGLPVSVTRDNLDRMTQAFVAFGADVVLAGITLPLNYGEDYIRDFEQIYPMLERKHKIRRIGFLLEGVALQPGLMQPDKIHPTAEGNKIVARTVFEATKPLLKK